MTTCCVTHAMTNSQKININKKMIACIKWTVPILDDGPNSSDNENSQEGGKLQRPAHDKKNEEPATIQSNIANTVLINCKAGDEKCAKCKKNVLNGIRGISCLKAWHCKCGGPNKEDI